MWNVLVTALLGVFRLIVSAHLIFYVESSFIRLLRFWGDRSKTQVAVMPHSVCASVWCVYIYLHVCLFSEPADCGVKIESWASAKKKWRFKIIKWSWDRWREQMDEKRRREEERGRASGTYRCSGRCGPACPAEGMIVWSCTSLRSSSSGRSLSPEEKEEGE